MAGEVKDDRCIETGSQSSDSDKEQHEEVDEPADLDKCHSDKQNESTPIGNKMAFFVRNMKTTWRKMKRMIQLWLTVFQKMKIWRT